MITIAALRSGGTGGATIPGERCCVEARKPVPAFHWKVGAGGTAFRAKSA